MATYTCRQHADCEVIFRTYVPKVEKTESEKSDSDENKKFVVKLRKGKPPIIVIHLRKNENQ